MIDFRYHLVSIIAVFLALTVGLALGTTMLQDPLLNTLQSETADLRGQSEELRLERDASERVNEGADELSEAAAQDLLEDRLQGLGVAVVVAPGAEEDMATALAARVEEAGGEVVGRISFTEEFPDEANAAFVDELAVQVSAEAEEMDGGAYVKSATLIGGALARSGGDEESDDERDVGRGRESSDGEEGSDDGEGSDGGGGVDPAAVLAAYSEADLLAVEGDPAGAADAVLVVAPAVDGVEGDPERTNTVVATVASTLSEQVGPTVLAGDMRSGRDEGLIAQVRVHEPDYATVDVAGRPMGDIVTVLALADSLEGGGAAYGVGEGVEGFLPSPLPGPLSAGPQESGGDEEASARPDDEARRAASGE
ncbi:copper transport outer membrane protein MctB [Nocardiopsis sp. Huas11]|uniref:copper transporter n=1 Tax=Nocardiopsis sp. Huas11 TaxID=2183912 RepID=UPI000EB09D88|nr:copper transporter [Nocardiopsis sp. Huas11]RKS07708.1 copper transport outer membrane protein MctB [Nocardiopsis sp. Huas11]